MRYLIDEGNRSNYLCTRAMDDLEYIVMIQVNIILASTLDMKLYIGIKNRLNSGGSKW